MSERAESDMHVISVASVTPGARFSDDVYFADGENLFIAANKEVKPYHEEALIRWKVPVLLSRGTLIAEGRPAHAVTAESRKQPE